MVIKQAINEKVQGSVASGVVANIYLAERMASAERESNITGVWGQSPQRGPGAEPLVGDQGGEALLKLKRFYVLDMQWSSYIFKLWCVNNRIKKSFLLSLSVKKIKMNKYFAKLQARTSLSHALYAPDQHTANRRRNCMRQSRSCL